MKIAVRNKPRMTFSAMCRYLSANPSEQFRILRGQKFPESPVVNNYNNAVRQILDFAIHGNPLNPKRGNLKPHEMEVVSLLHANNWTIPTEGAIRPSIPQEKMVLSGVTLSISPDLQLIGRDKKRRATGAMKFHFPKSYSLDDDVGRWMAALLYVHQSEILKDRLTSPHLCMVYDVRSDKIHRATGRYQSLMKHVSDACRMINSVWPSIV